MAATTDGTEEQTSTSGSRQQAPRRRRGTGRIAMAVSFFGELLITAGLVLGLFVVYSLWWTNVVADRTAHKQADKVRDSWTAQKDTGPGALDTKNGIGFLHVPALKNGEVLVEKGTEAKELNDGVAGYYTDPVKATLPTSGKKGNFTLAAHRDGHGAKFHNIDKIKKGDPIVFETKDKWYVYKVYAILPETSKYNVKVLGKIPKESGKKKAGHYITLTTCTPVYTSRYRYVVWGELVRVDAVNSERTPPKELG
ncbi:class E sortase [Streptomyces fulvoviolaceus]|uniref:class E sortase n=1 Tax=Streptomyces fulvoviolaceus TaxID=285535 RepID=UPI0004C7C7F6|nr:class E sortase [Streptomyces fulvoviolaceus]